MVDEIQDSNRVQYEIIKKIGKTQHLFVIGDPYQSIYSFRGADTTIFNQIKRDFPQSTQIVLRDNYRSAKEIVQASSALFPENSHLRSYNLAVGTIQLTTTYDEYTEAEYILKIVNKKVGGVDLLKAEGVDHEEIRFSDIAVLYRTHHIGGRLQQAFMDSGIPFQVVGENSPYEKPQILFISNIITYCVIKDDIALQDLLYSPILKVPPRLLRVIRQLKAEKKCSYRESIDLALEQERGFKNKKIGLSTWFRELKTLILELSSKRLVETIHTICSHYQLENSIDLQQYISCALQFDAKGGAPASVKHLCYSKEHEC